MDSAVDYVRNYYEDTQSLYTFTAIIITPLSLFALKKLVPVISRSRAQSKIDRSKVLSGTLIALIVALNLNVWYYLVNSIVEFHNLYKNTSGPSFNLLNSPISENIISLEYSDFKIPGYSFIEKGIDDIQDFKCGDVRFYDDHGVKASKPRSLDQKRDMKMIRDRALQMNSTGEYPIIKYCFLDKAGEEEDVILNKKWYKFAGSSTWLDKYQVYFLVSRVVYSHHEYPRNHATISIAYAQIFNKNWEEILDYQFPQSDLVFPAILPVDLDEHPKGQDIYLGADDPRVILRNYNDTTSGTQEQEPVIIFNTYRADLGWKRAIHVYRPLTNPRKATPMMLVGMEPKKREKNWSPFFDEDSSSINFVYSFNPLRIVKCDFDVGACNKISGAPFEHVDARALRGGTNLVRIPASFFPKHLADKREYWFGIARSHDKECGCINTIYRPHSFVISKAYKANDYTLDYVSSLIDFNINTRAWNPKLEKAKCTDSKSVLIPNSIAYWDVVTRKDKEGNVQVEDIMGVTYSEADTNNRIVHIKGYLEHVTNIFSGQKEIVGDHYSHLDTVAEENDLLSKCATSLADEYCNSAKKKFKWLFERDDKNNT